MKTGWTSTINKTSKNRQRFVQINDESAIRIGKNVLMNRLGILNNKIEYEWLNQSLNTFKIKNNREELCEELGQYDWSCNRTDTQSYYDWLENQILEVVDSIIPYKLITPNYKYQAENTKTLNLVRKKRSLLQRWRRHGRLQDKQNVKKLNKEIRKSLLNTKESEEKSYLEILKHYGMLQK